MGRMLKVCVLASGSSGNATLVRTPRTTVLIDAGLSATDLTRRLDGLGVRLASLDAILVGHDHGDHTRGLAVLSRRWTGPVYMNRDTADLVREKGRAGRLHLFENDQVWEIGDFRISPFPVQHDAVDPVGFVLEAGDCKVTVATDLGVVTGIVREAFRGARVAVIEANYDRNLLLDGSRPWSLKQRIAGNRGHLENNAAAELLAEVGGNCLEDVFLAHLSRDCNLPELALETVRTRLVREGHTRVRVHLTYQDRPSREVKTPLAGSSDSHVVSGGNAFDAAGSLG